MVKKEKKSRIESVYHYEQTQENEFVHIGINWSEIIRWKLKWHTTVGSLKQRQLDFSGIYADEDRSGNRVIDQDDEFQR